MSCILPTFTNNCSSNDFTESVEGHNSIIPSSSDPTDKFLHTICFYEILRWRDMLTERNLSLAGQNTTSSKLLHPGIKSLAQIGDGALKGGSEGYHSLPDSQTTVVRAQVERYLRAPDHI